MKAGFPVSLDSVNRILNMYCWRLSRVTMAPEHNHILIEITGLGSGHLFTITLLLYYMATKWVHNPPGVCAKSIASYHCSKHSILFRGEYMSQKIWNCLPWNSGYFETVCPGQPENLQNCLSKRKVNIFWAMLKNIIDSFKNCLFYISLI